MKQETFRDIPGYYGLYQVSSYGRVFSLKCNRFKELKPLEYKKNNYPSEVVLRKNKYSNSYRIDQLVLASFVCIMPGDFKIIHLNGNKKDCRLKNLCWIHLSCLYPEEVNKKYKLTSYAKQFIRETKDIYSVKELAFMFHVSKDTIYKYIGGR
jgi:hypothetical protein